MTILFLLFLILVFVFMSKKETNPNQQTHSRREPKNISNDPVAPLFFLGIFDMGVGDNSPEESQYLDEHEDNWENDDWTNDDYENDAFY